MPDEYQFSLTLNTEERLPADDVASLLRHTLTLLRDIERTISREKPSAAWQWDEQSRLTFVASVNGLKASELERIVTSAQTGFRRAHEAAQSNSPVSWPAEFGAEAKRSATEILKHLERITSLTVEATDQEPIDIIEARIDQLLRARPSSAVVSTVEGTLELIAHKEGSRIITAGIREHGTRRYIRCTLDAERWLAYLKENGMWEKRVIVEGDVVYADDGRPTSVRNVIRIRERRAGRPLKDFRGAASGITNGQSAEEFREQLYGDE